MKFLGSLFVSKPLNSVAVAAFFLASYFARRFMTVAATVIPAGLLW